MPLDGASAGAGALANMAGTFINAAITDRNNKQQRKWNEKMYNQQRAHALADWEMENAYNSPRSQMARLKEAGLNPHLVYGNGATATGGDVRNTDVKSWNPDAPQLDFSGVGTAFQQYFDFQVKQAQTDNLKTNTVVALEEAKLKAAQTLDTYARTANTQINSAKTEYDLNLAKELKDITIEAAKKNVEKLGADINYTNDQNRRQQELHRGNLNEQQYQIRKLGMQIVSEQLQQARTKQEVKNLETQGQILLSDEQIKKIELDLRKNNLTPNSPWYQKALKDALERASQMNRFRTNIPKTNNNYPFIGVQR